MLVLSAKVLVRPLADCVAPPVTSKILKYCLDGVVPRKVLNGLSNTSISMLFDGSRPLYSTTHTANPIRLRAGKTYAGRVSVIDSTTEFLDRVSSSGLQSFQCESVYGKFLIEFEEFSVTHLESLDMDLPTVFKLSFITPTVLSSKLMCPPPLSKRVRSMHKLVPQPSLIFSHLLRMWNTFAEPEHKIGKPSEWAPYMLGRQVDLVLAELDYRIRPETVIVGKDEKERLRKARGFTGWVIYKSIAKPKFHKTIAKLLALAELTGVGRSRGIGLGHIAVAGLTAKSPQTKQTSPEDSHGLRQ
ncbi:MAG: CRISPR system precrRNA processing endoribonuclease RAMP protein Cas6 [Sulfolobales archaeon]